MKSHFTTLYLSEALTQKNIEWLYVDILVTDGQPIPDDFSIPSHVLVIEKDDDSTLHTLLRYPGNDFITKIGHGAINAWGPLLDYEMLPKEMVLDRIQKGIDAGRNTNIIGHLLAGDRFITGKEKTPLEHLVEHIKSTAFREGFTLTINNNIETSSFKLSLQESALLLLAKEIVANWHHHSSGDEKIELKENDKGILLICSNKSDISLPEKHLTALIRRPFIRWGSADTTGLGYFIISLISSYGAIEWTTHYEKGRFLLTLSFS